MTGILNPPLVHINASLDDLQRARGAAVLVAAQAFPKGSLSELMSLADYVFQGTLLPRLGTLPQVFTSTNIAADPRTGPVLRASQRIPNFGDLDEGDGNGEPA